jgi:hypothetical protein
MSDVQPEVTDNTGSRRDILSVSSEVVNLRTARKDGHPLH